MAPTVREVLHGSAGGSNVSLVTGSGTAVDDWLVCIHSTNYYTLAGMTAPTGTAGTWSQKTSADLGTNSPHFKVWTRKVTSGGAQTVTTAPVTDEENYQYLYVVAGADSTDPHDGAAGNTGTASPNHVAPNITTGSDSLLICAWMSGLAATVDYTYPGSMTGSGEEETAGFGTVGSARETLSAPMSGTRTATASPDSRPFIAVSIALKAASAAAYVRPKIHGSATAIHRASGW